eukprot:3768808-Rhodomonas_salina.5
MPLLGSDAFACIRSTHSRRLVRWSRMRAAKGHVEGEREGGRQEDEHEAEPNASGSEGAAPHRGAHLVSGGNEPVAIQVLHVDLHVRHALARVHQHTRPDRVRLRALP